MCLVKCTLFFVSNDDSLDWKNLPSDEIVDRVTKKVKPGSIVLFHNAAVNTPDALPKILETLQGEGYQIVPVSELIMRDNFSIDSTGKQIKKEQSQEQESTSSPVPSPAASAETEKKEEGAA